MLAFLLVQRVYAVMKRSLRVEERVLKHLIGESPVLNVLFWFQRISDLHTQVERGNGLSFWKIVEKWAGI